MKPDLLGTLNPSQYQAVTSTSSGHILVLAGAGTGKTKVLTHRIAWLLTTQRAQTHNILAVTFTNKAAREMCTRIEILLDNATQNLWANTFHSIAHLLLRKHSQLANLPSTFQIIDNSEQLTTIKQTINHLGLDDKIFTPKQAQHFINSHKDRGFRAKDLIIDLADTWHQQMLTIYAAYENQCQQTGMLDFAELLLRCCELWQNHPQLLAHYHQRFRYILVDEFQDTNPIQYQWLQLLTGTNTQLLVVGDDDQSIFSWRQANAENLTTFTQQFPQVQLIRLEQNYRSTHTILKIANILITHNQQRLGKNLWTNSPHTNPVYHYQASTDIDEARFVIQTLLAWPGQHQEIAILYRTTAQSRLFEDELLRYQIPYRIYGSLRFYERLEIKDLLAYLRLTYHPHDDRALERVINTPKRGIGEQTLTLLRIINQLPKPHYPTNSRN